MHPHELGTALSTLAVHRPVFHSEADFQHEFALVLRALPGVRSIRLERPFNVVGRINLDILVGTDDGRIALELKH
jgi:hypothetical protein